MGKKIAELAQRYKNLLWSHRLQDIYSKETKCYLCCQPFIPGHSLLKKVRDHCHYSVPNWNALENCYESHYLGAAHAKCNLNRKCSPQIPVYVHNFMSYDSNFLIKNLKEVEKLQNLKAVPYNSNKLRTLSLFNFQFLDSYQIMNASLSQLTNDLVQSQHSWPILKQVDFCSSNNHLNLLLRKSIYPYEWVTSVEQLRNYKTLPPREAFYSKLSQKNISREDYNHGLKMYSLFNCQNMLDYTELYCKLDTLLLAEIVMTFRKLMHDHFQLWVENYISIPQLAFDAFLLKNKQPLILCSDPTMIQMFESNIRGGVSFVNNRHTKMIPGETEIMYVDANNLYGFAQCLPLPVGGYAWLDASSFPLKKISDMSLHQPVGYIFEVDLKIPSNLHEMLDDLPLAPVQKIITFKELSEYSKHVQIQLFGKKKASHYITQKLVTSHQKKERYVVHYMNLQFYLRMGCQVTKVHQVIQFHQTPFLKEHITKLSQLRAQTNSKFKQLLYKLMANSLYGKFIQNCRKFLSIKLCKSASMLTRYVSDPKFHSLITIDDETSLILMKKKSVKLDKLYAVGFSILELSKLHMYQLWYDYIKIRLPPLSVELILTDTDSFIIKLINISKHKALWLIKEIMDFSNFPKNHPFYNECHKKVPGYLKDEYPMDTIHECVAVKSKCYYLKFWNNATQVCKGISKHVSNNFPIEFYLSCVYTPNAKIRETMFSIRSKSHTVSTMAITKFCMTSGDDKRFQTCHLHSVAYGHTNQTNKKCFKCL